MHNRWYIKLLFCDIRKVGYTVYILYSKSIKKYYTGQTQDLVNRFAEHNSKETKSIRNGIPWILVWSKGVSTRGEAMTLENKIKKRGAGRFLNDVGINLAWPVSRGAFRAKIVSSNLATPTSGQTGIFSICPVFILPKIHVQRVNKAYCLIDEGSSKFESIKC